MKPLLFLSQRIPYPPNKGDKLRSFSVLRHLAKSWKIYLGCFVDDPSDWHYVADLRPYCADLCCIGLDGRWAKLKSLTGLIAGTSLSEPYFRSVQLSKWVNSVLRDVEPPAAFLYSSVMGQYVRRRSQSRPGRVVMDFVDVDSDKWCQYGQMHSWPMSWVYGRESRRLLAFDRDVASRTDASVFVSEPEAALFRRLAPEAASKTYAITNGIDFSYFAAGTDQPNPFPPGNRGVVFTGAMDYWPNADAAAWFAESLYPAVRRSVPEAVFFIVGGNPTGKVRKLGELPGVTVTGRVPDVRPYLAHAAVSVAPMRVARGIQNKVLEGMSMGRVVVTTDQGLEGIDAPPWPRPVGRQRCRCLHCRHGEGADRFSLARIGGAARRCIVNGYSWDDKLEDFERLLRGQRLDKEG